MKCKFLLNRLIITLYPKHLTKNVIENVGSILDVTSLGYTRHLGKGT